MDNTNEIKYDSVESEAVVKDAECNEKIACSKDSPKIDSCNFSSDIVSELGETETNVNDAECDIETFSAKDCNNLENSSEVDVENVVSVDITPEKDGGVLKKVLKEGEGEEYPGYGDRVSVHYTGWRLGKEPVEFDSSRKGERFEFSLGRGMLFHLHLLIISVITRYFFKPAAPCNFLKAVKYTSICTQISLEIFSLPQYF